MIVRLAQVLACAFVLLACTPSPKSKPDAPGCGFHADEHALVFWSSGSSFNTDLREFTAYGDGHVDVRGNVANGTAHVTPARIEQLQRDIAATDVFDEDQGCYYDDDLPTDSEGSSLVAQNNGAQRKYSVAGDAPDAVTRAMDVSARFFDEVAPAAK